MLVAADFEATRNNVENVIRKRTRANWPGSLDLAHPLIARVVEELATGLHGAADRFGDMKRQVKRRVVQQIKRCAIRPRHIRRLRRCWAGVAHDVAAGVVVHRTGAAAAGGAGNGAQAIASCREAHRHARFASQVPGNVIGIGARATRVTLPAAQAFFSAPNVAGKAVVSAKLDVFVDLVGSEL